MTQGPGGSVQGVSGGRAAGHVVGEHRVAAEMRRKGAGCGQLVRSVVSSAGEQSMCGHVLLLRVALAVGLCRLCRPNAQALPALSQMRLNNGEGPLLDHHTVCVIRATPGGRQMNDATGCNHNSARRLGLFTYSCGCAVMYPLHKLHTAERHDAVALAA